MKENHLKWRENNTKNVQNGASKNASSLKEKAQARKEKYLWNQFHLTLQDHRKIWDFQRGLCAICKRPLQKANVDHSHLSGKIFGLLCWLCNKTLGNLHERSDWLEAALHYLLHPPADAALGHETFGLTGRVGTKRSRILAKKFSACHKKSA